MEKQSVPPHALSVSDEAIFDILKKFFGHNSFRGPQLDIIHAAIAGQDTFVCMATGSGKSLCYQLPAIALRKTVIVISPLISLMQDQVAKLQNIGASSCFLGSAQRDPTVEDRMLRGEYSVVYLTPEKAVSWQSTLATFASTGKLCLFAVDESHCVSEWGHDFRPEYRRLGDVRTALASVPCMALTASATFTVQNDIIKQLHLGIIRPLHAVRTTFNRPNLHYTMVKKGSNPRTIIVDLLNKTLKESGTVVVYCTTVADVDTLVEYLKLHNIRSVGYHAKLTLKDREMALEQFMLDEVRVVVATVAFGMGIDKPDIRLIVHFGIPKTVEEYYQQSGRDGDPARCVLLYSDGDLQMKTSFYLEGIVNEAAKMEMIRKIATMRSLVTSTECRRAAILRYFDEAEVFDCDKQCDNCENNTHANASIMDLTTPAVLLLRAVEETGGKFGMGIPVDVLLGKRTAKLLQYHHDKLRIYGQGRAHSEGYWKALFWLLIQHGYIKEVYTQSGKLSFKTYALGPLCSRGVIAVQEVALLPSSTLLDEIAREKGTHRAVGDRVRAGSALDEASAALYDHLAALRTLTAREKRLPPFVIFSNETLRDMALRRPTNQRSFATIAGVGDFKLNEYGDTWAAAIAAFCRSRPDLAGKTDLTVDQASGGTSGWLGALSSRHRPLSTPRGVTTTVYESLQLFNNGKTIAEIAIAREIQESTVSGHLAQALHAGEKLSVKRLLAEISITDAMLAKIARLPSRDLRTVKEAFEGPEEISWAQARVALVLLEVNPAFRVAQPTASLSENTQPLKEEDEPLATNESELTSPIPQSVLSPVWRRHGRAPSAAEKPEYAGEVPRSSSASNLFALRSSTEALPSSIEPIAPSTIVAVAGTDDQETRGIKRTQSAAGIDDEKATVEERIARNRQRALERKRQKLLDRGQI